MEEEEKRAKRAGQTGRACPIIRVMYSFEMNEIGSDSMIA